MKITLFILLLAAATSLFGQNRKTDVLTLGTFHFAFYNRDVVNTEKKDQVDVLDPEHQIEIEKIVTLLSAYHPTIIAIEREPAQQTETDSTYHAYLNGKYNLSRSEDEQIGFRLAKKSGLKKLYCVNDWGLNYEYVDSTLGSDSITLKRFEGYFYHNPDSLKFFNPEKIFKTHGILAELKRMNQDTVLTSDLGNYFIGPFKFETKKNIFFGADYVTGWWFNRNLRIFRNIQKISLKPSDRILVIYGAGHMNLLNLFFRASPEFNLKKITDYLK